MAALLGAVPDGSALADQQLFVSVAREHAGWAEQLDRRRPGLRSLFVSQLAVYERLRLDAIAGTPLDQTFVKRLHEMVCRTNTPTLSWAVTGLHAAAVAERSLQALAEPRSRDATALAMRWSHEYPGASEVAAAMDAFSAELSADAYLTAHPVLQASYALHGLTAIHPFADGNGRVGRALASVAFLRARRFRSSSNTRNGSSTSTRSGRGRR